MHALGLTPRIMVTLMCCGKHEIHIKGGKEYEVGEEMKNRSRECNL